MGIGSSKGSAHQQREIAPRLSKGGENAVRGVRALPEYPNFTTRHRTRSVFLIQQPRLANQTMYPLTGQKFLLVLGST